MYQSKAVVKLFLLSALIFGLTIPVHAQVEQLRLSTYIPAPFGQFDRLRFVPRTTLAGNCDIGTMYAETTGTPKYCTDNGSGVGTWGTLPGVWTQSGSDKIFLTDNLANPAPPPWYHVGIGTTNPQFTLHLYQPIRQGNSTVPDLELRLQNADSSSSYITFEKGVSPDTDPRFYMRYLESGDAWFIFNGTNPAVTGDLSNPVMTMQRDSNPDTGQFKGVGIGVPQQYNVQAKLEVQSSGAEDTLRLSAVDPNNIASILTAVTVKPNGKVGIGTTDPQALLHVKNGDILVENLTNISHGANIKFQPNDGYGFQIHAHEQRLRFNNYDDDVALMTLRRVNNADEINVGIMNDSPGYRLDVAGDINVAAGSSYLYKGATCVAGACASDQRLKENIQPLSGSLEKISQLNPVRFNFTDPKYGQGAQIGLVAQDVEKIFPEWIDKNKDGYKSIIYGVQIPIYTISAVKELKSQVDELKSENASLKEFLEKQQKQIEELQTKIGGM